MPNLTGRFAMLEQLAAEGVQYVFGNPGTTEQAFLDALQDYPQIQYILALQESVALGLADGYARGSGRPAFAQLHAAPGLGNAMGMLYNALRNRTPMVAYAGQHAQYGSQQEPILAGDLVRMAEPVTKWAVEARDAREIPFLLRRAFKAAMEPPRGPVLIAVPANLMDEESGAALPASYPDHRPRPSHESVRRAVEMILEAKSPLIIPGDSVATSGASSDLIRLAEMIGARIHIPFCPEVPVPTDHPLYGGLLNALSGPGLKGQLLGADLVLAIGTPILPLLFPLDGSPFAKNAAVVHIDLEPWELDKNWPATESILADPGQALVDITAMLEPHLDAVYRDQATQRTASVRKLNEQLFAVLDAGAHMKWETAPVGAGRMMKEIADAVRPDTVIFDEAISASGYVMRYLRFREPGSHFRATGGGLGAGLPGALGLKLAKPDKPVMAILGDGAALYTIQGLWTAAHHNIPVTFVIVNNASYRILKLNTLEYLGKAAPGRNFVAMDLAEPSLDFAQIAHSFGVKGLRVTEPGQIGEAVREAQGAEGACLLDVVVDGDVGTLWL